MADSTGRADLTPEPANQNNRFELTFNIETLRMIAYLALVAMVVVGVVVTAKFVDVPAESTVIFATFGFNHICNVFDHQPSRTTSALLVLTFIIPMALFVVTAHYRTRDAVVEGRVPRSLATYSTITTPFVLLSVCYTYLWFVNSPDGDYGFIAHYLPYVALQLALGLLAIHEVRFLIHTGRLPFGASPALARTYLWLLLAITVACQVAVFSLLLGVPILDSVNDPGQRTAFQILMYTYSFLAIVMPIFFAARNRKNGLISTVSIG